MIIIESKRGQRDRYLVNSFGQPLLPVLSVKKGWIIL